MIPTTEGVSLVATNERTIMKTTDTSVAREILNQLGGNRFLAMTGAQSLSLNENSLAFRIPQSITKRRIAMVRVTLDPMDTYTVDFMTVRGLKVVTVAKHEGVYCDQLEDIFARVTGLATRL
jgi:hypothetical protein